MAHDLDSVRAALVKSRRRLLPQTNVVATGVGYKVTRGRKTDELSIVCSVTRKVALSQPAPRDQVPSTIDGIPTDVVATGVASVNVRPVMAAAFPPRLPTLRLGAAGSRPD